MGGQSRQSVRHTGVIGYYLALVAVTILVGTVVDSAMAPTFLWTIVAWGVITTMAVPGRQTAGQGFFVAISVSLVVRDYSGLTVDAQLWAFANLVVLLGIFWLRPLRQTKGFPFVQLWCLIQAIYVYVSSLISHPPESFRYVFTPEVRATGYRTLFIFNVLLVATSLATSRLLAGTAVDRDAEPITPPRAAIGRAYVLMALTVFVIGVTKVTGSDARLGSINQAIQLVGFGGCLVLVSMWLNGRLPIVHRVVLVAVVGLITLGVLGSGALYATAAPGFLVLALFLAQRRRVPWTVMLAVLAVLLILNINKGAFRQETWNGASDETSTTLGVNWIQQTTSSLNQTTDEKVSVSANRFGNSDILGYIVTWVPDRYEYFGYESYTSLPTVLIPRVLLTDKPSFNLENEFGRKYEFISKSDYATTVNTPLHVESYAAGGLFMMVLIAIFSGFYLTMLGWAIKALTPAGIITGALLSYQVILSIESGILGFVLTIPFALFLYPILKWSCREPPLSKRTQSAAGIGNPMARRQQPS